jgi:predicted glutamine amidotransferase
VIVASEPLDDEADWVRVAEGSRLTATAEGASVVPLTPVGIEPPP